MLRALVILAMLVLASPVLAEENPLPCWPQGKEAGKAGKYYIYKRTNDGKPDFVQTYVAAEKHKDSGVLWCNYTRRATEKKDAFSNIKHRDENGSRFGLAILMETLKKWPPEGWLMIRRISSAIGRRGNAVLTVAHAPLALMASLNWSVWTKKAAFSGMSSKNSGMMACWSVKR